jgi:hypothetical protein
MGELRRMHCRHCLQTFLSDDLEKCAACCWVGGMMDLRDPGALHDLPAPQPRPVWKPPERGQPMMGPREFISKSSAVKNAVKLGFGGLFCLGVGLAFFLVPGLRSDPRSLTLNDTAAGLGAIVVGVILLGLALAPLLPHRPPAAKDEHEPGGE